MKKAMDKFVSNLCKYNPTRKMNRKWSSDADTVCELVRHATNDYVHDKKSKIAHQSSSFWLDCSWIDWMDDELK